MVEKFDPLTALLSLVEPGFTEDQLYNLSSKLLPEQWDAIIVEAYQQDIAEFLYALLRRLNQSYGFEIPQKDRLHQTYLSTASKNMLTLHDTGLVFSALQQAGIPAAGLKGVYLLENVYGDVGARSMNDIDILVKKHNLTGSLEVLERLGYSQTSYFSLDDLNADTKHYSPMRKTSGPMVELHWTLNEENELFTVDPNPLWDRVVPARIAGIDSLSLGVEDLILHLCLHTSYQHYLQLGLRGLLDIAMVLNKFQGKIDWQNLVQIVKSWGTERITALSLKLVETQLNVAIPLEVFESLLPEPIAPGILENARKVLLERVNYQERLTPDLVQMNANRDLFSKVKIGLQRVFIPRLAMARTYNVSPDSPRILGFYWVRLKYLVRNYGKTLLRLQRQEESTTPAFKKPRELIPCTNGCAAKGNRLSGRMK